MTRSEIIREVRAKRSNIIRQLPLVKPRSQQRLILEAKLARVTNQLLRYESIPVVRVHAVTKRRVA